MKKKPSEVTLALETAVKGGSISILEGEKEIDFWAGGEESLKAQDFLLQIKGLLKRNKISSTLISEIAVATGPGSFTGIRIGISIALGLKTAWSCRITGINILEALMLSTFDMRPIIKEGFTFYIPVIPFGKKEVCWQIFPKFEFENETKLKGNTIQVAVLEEFLKFLNEYDEFILFTEDSLFRVLNEAEIPEQKKVKIKNVGKNLARLVGLQAIKGFQSDLVAVYAKR